MFNSNWTSAALESLPQSELLARASALRDEGHGNRVSFSRKVFIPLTRLCRDVCHYCTFAHPPRDGERAYLTPDEVLAIASAGAKAGCQEALFTLGDKPELRYRQAAEELAQLGHETTISYLVAMCALVLEKTGLLPHANPGVMSREEIAALRRVSVSQGIMLESASARLCERGGPHFGSPDKEPAARLEVLRLAGELAVPFTTGILIGIGETRAERIASIEAIMDLHRRYGHIQEIIVQNFRAKPGTLMAAAGEPSADELKWTIAAARLIAGPHMNIQAPPNLSQSYPELIDAGISDWGGISPVTPDHVNPEAPWPDIEMLRRHTAAAGKTLVERLAIYPSFAREPARWLDASLAAPVLRASDAESYARDDAWAPGITGTALSFVPKFGAVSPGIAEILARVGEEPLGESDATKLFCARGSDFHAVCEAADALRARVNGDTVTYVVNRNINYTNICLYKCGFCAFSKGRTHEQLRGQPYDLPLEEVQRRVVEAWQRGATEVCMQGGIHPYYTGHTYLELCRAVKSACPGMHVHAFSPLEVTHGAKSLGLSLPEFLGELRSAGLGTLPGTAAEILDDEVRKVVCADKLKTAEWLEVMRAAHGVGVRATTTIMFGHMEHPGHWARHLLRLRELQTETGGFTEFVPLPFVHMEAPMYMKGRARRGPTSREAVLMHAVPRLVLHPHITNIQTSWVKMGPEGVHACLAAGVNDLGGTLMNESISRAAGTGHGQELPPEAMHELIAKAGRRPQQRTTLYERPAAEREAASLHAPALTEVRLGTPPVHRKSAIQSAERK